MSVEWISELEGQDALLNDSLRVLAQRSIEAVIQCDGFDFPYLISVVFTDDAHIWALNKKMRGVDRSTDVLSFPMVRFASLDKSLYHPRKRECDVETGEVYLGDMVISVEHARAQAEEYGHSFEREVGYLCAHSAAHLLGYDHETESDRALMRDLEERALSRINLKRM